MPRLFRIANRRGLALACEEAAELLTLVRRARLSEHLAEQDFDKFVDKLRYEHAFGRLLTDDEESELESRPDIILVDA